MKNLKFFILLMISLVPIFSVYGQGGGNALNLINELDSRDGDFVFCGSPNYNFTNKITVAAWIKWTTTPGYLTTNHENEGKWATIITMDGHITRDQGQFWLQHKENNKKFEWAVQTEGGRNYVYSSTDPEINKWYYVVGTYDANADPKLKIYINGILENTVNNGISGNINPYNSSFKLNIGRLPSGYRYFSGNIDEIRIWNSALTQGEIIQQMYSKSTVASTTTNLLSYWDMDNISGSSVPDTKNFANGTFYTLLVDAHDCAPPTTPGGYGLSYGNNWLRDFDKIWTTNQYSGLNIYTVAGNGFGNSYTISSNTTDVITLSSNFTTTPVVDNYGSFQSGPNGMSWFGIEGSAETSQSVVSAAPVVNSTLSGFTDVCGIWDTKLSNTSSILTVSNTNIDINNTDECLLFGHNNFDFGTTSSGNPSGVANRFNRNWKFEVHKSGGVTAKLSFDCSGLSITDGSLLRLLVSSSSDFSSAAVYTGTYASNIFSVTLNTINGPNNSITDNTLITIGSTGVLPVNLQSFNYSVFSERNVNLDWKTNHEIENKGFSVERKKSFSNKWNSIGFVEGKNNNAENTYSFIDKNLNKGLYQYRLKQIDYNGNFEYFNLSGLVEINAPSKFKLHQNYPNPFNPETNIAFEIPENGFTKLIIYDITGKEIKTLVNEYKTSGFFIVSFKAESLPSGIYYYKLELNSGGIKSDKIMKCVLIK